MAFVTLSQAISQTKSPGRWAVWSGSARNYQFQKPIPKPKIRQLWHKARAWDAETRATKKHGGAIGRSALAVLYTLTHDFLNFTTGRLDPTITTIAKRSSLSPRAVQYALNRLKNLGLIDWTRRCEQSADELGRFMLRQLSNAYRILDKSEWIGYRDTTPAPLTKAELGCNPPFPDQIDRAIEEIASGNRQTALTDLKADPSDKLAQALAALGDLVEARYRTAKAAT